jgi:hypothetical protein
MCSSKNREIDAERVCCPAHGVAHVAFCTDAYRCVVDNRCSERLGLQHRHPAERIVYLRRLPQRRSWIDDHEDRRRRISDHFDQCIAPAPRETLELFRELSRGLRARDRSQQSIHTPVGRCDRLLGKCWRKLARDRSEREVVVDNDHSPELLTEVFRILSSQAIESLIERTRADDLRDYPARLVVENDRAAAAVRCELCSKISFHATSVPRPKADRISLWILADTGGHSVPLACPYGTEKGRTRQYQPTSRTTPDLRIFALGQLGITR